MTSLGMNGKNLNLKILYKIIKVYLLYASFILRSFLTRFETA